MPYIERDGVRIFYEATGSGPPILLTHGYSATGDMWRGQQEALSKGHQLIVWDMRGHGRSDSPDDQAAYSEAATVADMAALLDECAGSDAQAAIGGLSLGGYMSLAFHLAHPERTSALMVFDTGPGYRSDEPRAGWNRMVERMAARFETEGLAALGSSAEVRVSSHRSADGLARAARGMLAQHDGRVIDSLPHVAVPTLVLAGEKDEPFITSTNYMADRIPGATKVIIPDAGHAANIDQPQAFNRAVIDFLTTAGW